jgi:hypothetical protein
VALSQGMLSNGAANWRSNCPERVRTTSGTERLRGNIFLRTKQIGLGRNIVRGLLLIEHPSLFGLLNRPQVREARAVAVRSCTRHAIPNSKGDNRKEDSDDEILHGLAT